jgi:hypothetical protein
MLVWQEKIWPNSSFIIKVNHLNICVLVGKSVRATLKSQDERQIASPSTAKRFSCDLCSFSADRSSVIKGHISRAHNFECDECDETFKTRDDLDCHVDEVHNEEEVSDYETSKKKSKKPAKKFECEFCDFRADKMSAIKSHVNRLHNIGCKECDESFFNRDDLKRHVATSHSYATSSPSSKRHVATSHSYATSSSSSKAVVRFDKSTKLYSCSECVYSSNRRNNVHRHVENVHG